MAVAGRRKTKNEDALRNRTKENIFIVLDRIYNYSVADKDKKLFDGNYEELIKLFEARTIQNHLQNVIEHIDEGDVETAINIVDGFAMNKYDDSIQEFDYADGFKERFLKLSNFKKN